ncbi:hypothetical protein KY285_016572 [Solanum tuberosum]|nr:hypothetical protein KY285_016572 [Solanum tuberosum]
MAGFAREKRVNRILVDGGSGINILPIRTMKELGISTTELTNSHLMIQGFNQGGQRSIGTVKIDLTIGELQSSVWLHDGVAKRIIADDNPFTKAEAHFTDAKFYLKKYSIKVDDIASGDVRLLNNMAKVAVGKAKVANKEDSKLGNPNKMPNVIGVSSRLTLPVRQIDTMKSSTKLLGKSVAPKSLLHGKFVAPKSSQYEALPMKRTEEGFDPNAYRLLAKVGFDPNEPSKLGKLPSEPAMRQQREGLGYKQPSPIRVSIKRLNEEDFCI